MIDEVGQFVARDVQKMLDLQAVVQSLGRVGRGRMWLIVTSQEKLNELVGGLDDRRVELARLLDRFPQRLQVHLEPSDISEVTSRRVLAKKADAQVALRKLFEEHRGLLAETTRLTAAIKLPELSLQGFADLYPLLPYQIDLIINIVSGLRTAGGASRHVGGANRTIIKLAQQLLIHPSVNLASASVGQLARIDQVYDLVSGNIPSELRGKIDSIPARISDPAAQQVAKAICLLQYVQSVPRSAENLAATLQPDVRSGSRLGEVRATLDALEQALLVRRGEDGYRIPEPIEDDWEQQRGSVTAKAGDVSRLHAEAVEHLWHPQPSHSLRGVKPFKAGLYLNGRQLVTGDIDIHLALAEETELNAAMAEMRQRSQQETTAIFWAAALNDSLTRHTDEAFRSREILSRKERAAHTRDEAALIAEEKRRQKRHEDELRRLLAQAMLAGSVFFRGNDRSPDASATDVVRATAEILATSLPVVFSRFDEAAARVGRGDLDALMTDESLKGLPPVFTELDLLREEAGRPVFNCDQGPLAEILAKIEDRASYGETPTGRYLTEQFAKEPFGWDFDTVRLLTVSLLRAGKIQATSKTRVIDSAESLDARNTFPNNNLFRSASFQPKTGVAFEHIVEAADRFKAVFGSEVKELDQAVVAREIRTAVGQHEEVVRDMQVVLVQHRLPGAEPLESTLNHMTVIRGAPDDQVILKFNATHQELKDTIKRALELQHALTQGALADIERARQTLDRMRSLAGSDSELADAEGEEVKALADLLQQESFFRDLPAIGQQASRLSDAYAKRFTAAAQERVEAYQQALQELRATPGWERLNDAQQAEVSRALAHRAQPPDQSMSIPLLQEQANACVELLRSARRQALEMLDGARVVRVSLASFFASGIETEEQLEAALEGLREQITELIATGKKVIVD